MNFEVGDRPRSTWTVRLNGTVTDPPFVALITKNTAGEAVSFYGEPAQPLTIFKSSTGVYYADIPLTVSGQWYRRWVAFDEQGEPLDAYEAGFLVRTNFTDPLPATP